MAIKLYKFVKDYNKILFLQLINNKVFDYTSWWVKNIFIIEAWIFNILVKTYLILRSHEFYYILNYIRYKKLILKRQITMIDIKLNKTISTQISYLYFYNRKMASYILNNFY